MLSEALRFIRTYEDMKQKALAEKLGLSKSHICELETGKTQPSIQTLGMYSVFFRIPISSILFFAESLEKGKQAVPAVHWKIKEYLKIIHYKPPHDDTAPW